MYSLEEAQLFSLKDVCRVSVIYYLFLLQFPALWSRWWLGDFVWIGLWRLNFAAPLPQPGFNLLAGAREIPSHPSDASQGGRWLTQTRLLGVSRCPEYRSSANTIPRVIIPSSGSKSVSSILFRIITKHYYSFSIWPQSPRQITIRSMLSMSQPRRCRVTGLLSTDDPNSTILSPHETCFIIPALP